MMSIVTGLLVVEKAVLAVPRVSVVTVNYDTLI